jgi:hypothetical protein
VRVVGGEVGGLPVSECFTSRGLGNIGRLRTLRALGYLELNLVAFLQALVTLGGDSTVVDKNVRSIFTSEETIAFGIVEPLDGTFQTFHVRPLA